MLRNNSPTLQSMIDSVKPGSGNMNMTVPGYQGQFQTPYPSPKDMVMNAGIMNPYYQQQMPQYMMPPQQNMMYGFNTPSNMVGMINGVPTELEYKPHENPMNGGNTLHTSGLSMQNMPGRYMTVPQNTQFGDARMQMLNSQPNIVGGYKPYMGNLSIPTNTQAYKPVEPTPEILYYDGQILHPATNTAWYGSPDFPMEKPGGNLNDLMRQRFNEKFPGYNNPYMTQTFGQPQQPQFSRDVQYMANLAAYYGMTYSEFVANGTKMMKLMSKSASHYFGVSKEDADKREKLHDPKTMKKPGQEPDNDEELFYPVGAFDFGGQLTREYQGMFCVNKKRLDNAKKTLKVAVKVGEEVIECKKRPIDFTVSRENMDRWFKSDIQYRNWLVNNKFRLAQQYWNAPERRIDALEGNVFQVASRAIGFAEQQELEAKWRYQRYTMSSTMYNRDEFITKIKQVRENSKANAKAIDDAKFAALIHKVAGPKPGQEIKIPDYRDRPYICDGDWVIAKPGVDIVGLPLDVSVNKIVKLNTVTGEEEIYDPNKLMGADVRERIKAAMQPSFNDIDDNELERRLEAFKNASFSNYTDG